MIMGGGKMKKYTKYTDLEQASRDPSLAIITDRITTPEELSKLYAKYRILPKNRSGIPIITQMNSRAAEYRKCMSL